MKKLLFVVALLATSGVMHAAGNRIQVTTQAELDNAIKSKPVVFVLVSAQWCGHCKEIKPVIEQLTQENPNVLFVHVDANNKALADKYARAFPTMYVYKNGTQAAKIEGTRSKTELKGLIS